MSLKLSIRRKLFISFSVVFVIFTVLVLLFQYEREKDFRTGQLENTLDNISELTHHFIQENAISESGNFWSYPCGYCLLFFHRKAVSAASDGL